MNVLDFLKSSSGGLLIRGPAGAGKTTLVESVVGKFKKANRAVVGSYSASDIGMDCEPLILSLADLCANLTADASEEDMAKRRKILLASTRKIRKGEREATIVLLHEMFDLLKERSQEDFDPQFYGFLNIHPKDSDGVLMTLPELSEYLKENRQVFLNAIVHLLENIAGYLKRMKMKLVFLLPRARNIQQKAFAHIMNVVTRLSDNIYFIITIDDDTDKETANEKISYATGTGKVRILELKGLDRRGISKWYSTLTTGKPTKRDVENLSKISKGKPFYLRFLMEKIGTSNLTDDMNVTKKVSDLLRKEMENKGKKFTRFMEQYSLLTGKVDAEKLTKIFPFSADEFTDLERQAVEMSILERPGHFRHPLLRKHISDSIDDKRKKAYHENLADFYEEVFRTEADGYKIFDFRLVWAICHHYFNSGVREKSYSYNTFMAKEGFISGNLDVARIGYERALSDAIMLENDEYRISVIEKLVKVLEKEHRWDRALELHNMLVDHFSSTGDSNNKCIALLRIAAIHQYKGEFDNALKFYGQALRIYKKEEQKDKIANTLMNIGTLYQIKEDFEDALKNYRDSLNIFEELEDKAMSATLHHKLASIYHLDYKYTKALGHYNKSLKIFKEIDNKNGYGETLHQMANIHFLKEKNEMALKYYKKSLEVLREVNAKKGVAEIYYQMGVLSNKEGKYQESLDLLNDSLNIFREIQEIPNITNTIRTLGDTYIEIAKKQISAEKIPLAKETLNCAVRIFSQIGDRDGKEEADYLLEDVADIDSGKRTVAEVKNALR